MFGQLKDTRHRLEDRRKIVVTCEKFEKNVRSKINGKNADQLTAIAPAFHFGKLHPQNAKLFTIRLFSKVINCT